MMARHALPLVLMLLAACAQKAPQEAPPAIAETAPAGAGCLPDASGSFEAHLRGAIEADVQWRDAQMTCDGDIRPDGSGLRITLAGPHEGRQLRFIFGIDLQDADSGPARVLPTNLTVLVEGEATLFATRGSDRCATEDLVRTPLEGGVDRVGVRGYCVDPASDLAGVERLLVPTFTFTALVRREEGDAAAQ
jgi:hypothetical protein